MFFASRGVYMKARLADNLLTAHGALCKAGRAADVHRVITLTKFILRLSERLGDDVVQFVPEDDCQRRDHPPYDQRDLR